MSRDLAGRARSLAPFVVLACAAIVTAAETILLGFGTGYFGTGFNSVTLTGPLDVAAFLVASWLFDVGLVLVVWAMLLPLLRRVGTSPVTATAVLVSVSVGIPSLIAAYRYNVYAIAGELFSLALLRYVPLTSSSAMVGELVSDGWMIWAGAVGSAVLASFAAARMLGALEARHPIWRSRLALPSAAASAGVGALILLVGSLGLLIPASDSSRLRYGLERKGAVLATTALLRIATDVDGDGFGPLTRLGDPAPFDADRHPYAREIAGNGIDENGIGGDLDPAIADSGPIEAPLPAGGPRPHLLILYLESFRHDLLGQTVDGRPVTPFLDRLAAEGASTRHAYVHTPWTLDSRAQLFAGRVVAEEDGTTLIDDFLARGYEVLHFSGQDESYGDSARRLGVERAHHFYDARQDLERRSSRSTTPVSLQVSWKVLAERVAERLAQPRDERPLFVYVNLTDTHFPYLHHELDSILGVEPLERSMIRADRADDVRLGYANAAANVDRGAELVTAHFRAAIGDADHGILVLADHGEAIYEHGRLGHGLALDDVETRIPFVVWGIGGEWPEPVAPSDVRGLLRRNLSLEREQPRARFVADGEREIFQYAPSLDRPLTIALRGVAGRRLYDLEQNEARFERAEGDALPTVAAAEGPASRSEIVHAWERARIDETSAR